MVARLTDGERRAVEGCRHAVSVAAEARTGNILRDRKDFLRFLRALMGAEGVAALDHAARSFWSRPALDDELAHDADPTSMPSTRSTRSAPTRARPSAAGAGCTRTV
jgi:hypothetical protein